MADPLTTLGAIGIANAINGTDAPGVPAETYSSTTLPDAVIQEARESEDARYRPDISLVAGGSVEDGYIIGELGAKVSLTPKIGITGTLTFGGEKNSSTTYTTNPSPTGIYGQVTIDKVNSTRLGAGGSLDFWSKDLYMSLGGRFFYDIWRNETTENVLKGDTILNSITSSVTGKDLSGRFYLGLGKIFESRFGIEAGLSINPEKNDPSLNIRSLYQITPRNRSRESQ